MTGSDQPFSGFRTFTNVCGRSFFTFRRTGFPVSAGDVAHQHSGSEPQGCHVKRCNVNFPSGQAVSHGYDCYLPLGPSRNATPADVQRKPKTAAVQNWAIIGSHCFTYPETFRARICVMMAQKNGFKDLQKVCYQHRFSTQRYPKLDVEVCVLRCLEMSPVVWSPFHHFDCPDVRGFAPALSMSVKRNSRKRWHKDPKSIHQKYIIPEGYLSQHSCEDQKSWKGDAADAVLVSDKA
eukprot:s2586_g4.t1